MLYLTLVCGFFFSIKKKHCEQLRVLNALQGFWFLYVVVTQYTHTHTHMHTHTHSTERENKKAKGAREKKKTSRGVSKNSSYNQKEL